MISCQLSKLVPDSLTFVYTCVNRLGVMRNSGRAGLIERHLRKNQSQIHMTRLWTVSDGCSLFDPGVQIEPLLRYKWAHCECSVSSEVIQLLIFFLLLLFCETPHIAFFHHRTKTNYFCTQMLWQLMHSLPSQSHYYNAQNAFLAHHKLITVISKIIPNRRILITACLFAISLMYVCNISWPSGYPSLWQGENWSPDWALFPRFFFLFFFSL